MLAIGLPTPPPREDSAAAEAMRVLQQPESLVITVRCLVAFLLRREPHDPDVDDCTQETLRRALEGYARIDQRRALRPWVLGIARHVALDHLRQSQLDRMRLRDDETLADSGAIERLPSISPSTDVMLEEAERNERVRAAVDRLPSSQRRALLLFHVEGLSYREIGLRLGVPVGTVGTWIGRAREQLAGTVAREERG